MANLQERYENLIKLIENSDDPRKSDMLKLINHLESDTEWLKSPASTKYHGSCEGGLIIHSICVAELCMRLSKLLAGSRISLCSAIFVGLMHDIGKVGLYIQKEPTEKQLIYGYPGSIVYNSNILLPHAERSLQMIQEYVNMTEDEYLAIKYHNSPWDGNRDCAFFRYELMTILQMSDYWSTVYLEEGGAKNDQ